MVKTSRGTILIVKRSGAKCRQSLEAFECLGVMLEVIFHKSGDEVVGMIVARLHPHIQWHASDGTSVHEAGETGSGNGIEMIRQKIIPTIT